MALVQVKAGNTSENLLNEIELYILCIEKKNLLKNIQQHNGYMKL